MEIKKFNMTQFLAQGISTEPKWQNSLRLIKRSHIKIYGVQLKR